MFLALFKPHSFLFIIVTFSTFVNCEEADNFENGETTKLLLDKNNPLAPPTYNVSVGLLLHLSQIQKLDIKTQVLTTQIHLEVHWMDPRLTWNPTSHGHAKGIKHVALSSAKVWTPKLFLANSALGPLLQGTLSGEEILIDSNGHVTWHIYTTVQSSCTIDVRYYPFDQQTCVLTVATQDPGIQVALWKDRNYAMMDEFYISMEYSVVEVPAYLNVDRRPQDTESNVGYYVTMRRRTDWNTQVYPSLALALLTLLPHLISRSRVTVKFFLHMLSLSLLFVIWRDNGANIPSTLVTPQIFRFLYPMALFNLLHLLLTCLWSNYDQINATNQSTQTIFDKIRSCACCQNKHLPEHDEELVDSDRKSTGLRINQILCWISSMFTLVVVIGMILNTANFLLSAPHMFDHVEVDQVVEFHN